MKVHIIAAIDAMHGIGKDGAIPWSCKSDMRYFSKQTKGKGYNAIVMGKKTWDSLPRKPLPGRANFVLSRSMPEIPEKQLGQERLFFNDLDKLKKHYENKFEEVWIIGGEEIYKQFIDDPSVDAIYITNIPGTFECDTFFPEIPAQFTKKNNISLCDNTNITIFTKP